MGRVTKRVGAGLRKRAFRVWLRVAKPTHQIFRRKENEQAKQIVLVAGAQRSGTNMLMDVLERSFETEVFHETDPRAFENYAMRSGREIHNLATASRARCVVVKALCESQSIPELLEEFRPSSAIWVVRHFDDVVNSMNISFPKQRGLMLCVKQDRDAGGWRTEGMSDETYQQILPHIKEDMSHASAAALQWYLRNRLFFERELDKRSDVLLVRYEDLVREPRVALERITQFLGVSLSTFMFSHVHAKSVRKRQSPDIDEDVRALCADLWNQFDQLNQTS